MMPPLWVTALTGLYIIGVITSLHSSSHADLKDMDQGDKTTLTKLSARVQLIVFIIACMLVAVLWPLVLARNLLWLWLNRQVLFDLHDRFKDRPDAQVLVIKKSDGDHLCTRLPAERKVPVDELFAMHVTEDLEDP